MTTKTFQQLIDDHNFKLMAQAETQAQMSEAEERQRRQEIVEQNAVLWVRGRELLGAALFDELARPQPKDDVCVPLMFAPGPDMFLQLQFDNSNNVRLVATDPENEYAGMTRILLPADDDAIADALIRARKFRANARRRELERFTYDVTSGDDPHQILDEIIRLWPDLETECVDALNEGLARLAIKQAKKTETAEKDEQLLNVIKNDGVLAHVIKLVMAIQADRERYEEAVAGLDEALECEQESASQRLAEANTTIDKASRRERELEREKADAQDEAERYQNKLKKAGVR